MKNTVRKPEKAFNEGLTLRRITLVKGFFRLSYGIFHPIPAGLLIPGEDTVQGMDDEEVTSE